MDQINTLNRLHTVVNLIPELLSEIFVYVLRGHGHISPQRITSIEISSMRRARLNLCAVCVRWREIALSTPLLWSIVSFPPLVPISNTKFHGGGQLRSSPEAEDRIVARFVMDIFDEELRRAGNSALSLHILDPLDNCQSYMIPLFSSRSAEAIKIVNRLLPCCKHLHIAADAVSLIRLLCPPASLSLSHPYLQSLSTSIQLRNAGQSISGVLDLSWANHLHELKVMNRVYQQPVRLKISSNAVLRRLDVTEVSSEDAITILEQSPRLEELYWTSTDLLILPLGPIHLPCLTHLILSGANVPYALPLLDAPQLERLEIHYRWGAVGNHIRSPLSNSHQFPRLRTLIIDGSPHILGDSNSVLERFMEGHPSLQFIYLQFTSMPDTLMQTLSVLPSLCHLSLEHNPETGGDGIMIILQAWYAKAQKARAHPFHPTLYLRRGDLFEEFLDIEPSEFVVFARQVLLEFPPFSVRSSAAASWDGVFQALDAGKGLREFWQQ